MRWLDRLFGKADAAPADIGAAMAEAAAAAQRGDHAVALAIWGPLAHAGVARAQNNVGACFAEGIGVERDPALALRWLTLSAGSGARRSADGRRSRVHWQPSAASSAAITCDGI